MKLFQPNAFRLIYELDLLEITYAGLPHMMTNANCYKDRRTSLVKSLSVQLSFEIINYLKNLKKFFLQLLLAYCYIIKLFRHANSINTNY